MTAKRKNVVTGLFAYAISIWIWICSLSMGSYTNNRLSAAFIPRMIAIILVALGTIVIVRAIIKDKKAKAVETAVATEAAAPAEAKKGEVPAKLVPYITLALIFLYLLGLETLGFLIASTVYLTLQMTVLSGVFSKKALFKYLLIAVIAAVVIWLIFAKGLKLGLPVNPFGF